jgi:hypothetical protein
MNPQIIPRAERTAVAEPEPSLTISQLQNLLHAAADLERAQRPIVLHGPETATTRRAAAHDGIDIRVPAPPVATAQAAHAPKEFNAWPLAFTVSMVGVVTSAAAAAATGSECAVLAVFAFVSAWGASTYQIVFNHREA